MSTPLIITNKNPIFKPSERAFDVDLVRKNRIKGGHSTGFETLDPYFTVKQGFPLFIAGAPHHGKSQFVKQLLVNLSKLHGWIHAIYMGEEGSIEDIILELAEIYTGRKVLHHDDRGNKETDHLSDQEFHEVFKWIDKHFCMISPDDAGIDSFDVSMFYQWVEDYEKTYSVKFNTTLIDPWNDLQLDLESKGGREDLFLADALKKVRDQSRKHHRTDIITTHIANPQWKQRTEKGAPYSPPADAHSWAGGQTWHRRAFTMLLVFRPPSPDTLKKGQWKEETLKGETWILIQKSKPKGVGKLGMVKLWYNPKSNTYHEDPLDEDWNDESR